MQERIKNLLFYLVGCQRFSNGGQPPSTLIVNIAEKIVTDSFTVSSFNRHNPKVSNYAHDENFDFFHLVRIVLRSWYVHIHVNFIFNVAYCVDVFILRLQI